jgi:rhamnose transport system permease protein
MRSEGALVIVIAIEIAIFTAIAPNFATFANAAEIVRLAVEVGLIALALTPIVVTGGIDLSSGALLGLAAVVFGALWRDAGWPVPAAAAAAIGVAATGGALNAWLIARRGLPALMVTLGSLSLFRGLAEGLTGAVENYTGLPPAFLMLGQGYLAGIPAQAPVLAIAAVGFWLLLHRTTRGRSYFAIGWNADATVHAGVKVSSRLAELYVLSGIAAGVAAIIYVAHAGQAKADAGVGYELTAVTAVVLGGAAITGGVGTIGGTLLGLVAMVVLQNGLRLAALPAELAGILTGVLLLGALAIAKTTDFRLRTSGSARSPQSAARSPESGVRSRESAARSPESELEMRNSQLAVLCGVILLAAGIVAASNWWVVRSLRPAAAAPAADSTPAPGTRVTVGMMPKAKGDPYFVSVRKGADEAAAALGVDLLWDGPTELDPAKQNEVVEAWITRGVDVIAVSVENQAAISTVLRKARSRGIGVLTWDADAEPDARHFLVNQATPQGIGATLADEAARLLGGKGEFAIVTASLSAANQNEWMKHIRARLASAHPDVSIAVVRPSDGDRDRAFAETQTILKVHPSVRVVMGIAAPAVPGIAEAVKQSGRTDVKVTGLSLPNMCKPYVHAGIIDSVVLWNTGDLGYLTVHAANALARGTLRPGATSIDAGRLGAIAIEGDQILLGKPFVFTKQNIDNFDF